MTLKAQFDVFSPRFQHLKGQDSWRGNLRLTSLAADKIRSSLGPNGAYKMVTYNRGPERVVKITRDAVAVLEELAIQYPTLVVLSEAAKLQRQEMGDGVKSFIILTAELLKRADTLVSKGVHPTKVLKGYRDAANKALETIDSAAQPLAAEELSSVLETADCGRGCLTPELRRTLIEAKSIATFDGRLDRDRIRIIRKPGGSQPETSLIKGLVIKKDKLHPNMLHCVANARVALASGRIGINRLEVKMPGQGPFNMQYTIATPENMQKSQEAEKQRKRDALSPLQVYGVNVLLCQQPIDNYSKSRLLEMGVLAFSSVDRADLDAVSKATGARLVANLAELEQPDVGTADSVETDKIGLEDIAVFHGCQFATFMVRGAALQALDELELLIGNSLRLLAAAESGGRKVAGGGALEFQVARALKRFALRFSGREQLAIDNFAEALLEIPRCLAANSGVFADDALSQLGNMHASGVVNAGLKADGVCGAACMDVAEVKKAYVRRAFEVASLLLRIDEQVVAKELPKFHK